jgi:hypothetical protein
MLIALPCLMYHLLLQPSIAAASEATRTAASVSSPPTSVPASTWQANFCRLFMHPLPFAVGFGNLCFCARPCHPPLLQGRRLCPLLPPLLHLHRRQRVSDMLASKCASRLVPPRTHLFSTQCLVSQWLSQ